MSRFEWSCPSTRTLARFARLWVLLLWGAVGPLWSSVAAAGGSARLEIIRQRMEGGLALFLAGSYVEAASTFEAGYSEHPYSAFLFNAGVCYEKLNRPGDALAKYREYLRIDPGAPDADEVRAKVALLEAPPGENQPAGAAPGASPPPPPAAGVEEHMRALVLVETEPSGAPVRVFRPRQVSVPAYSPQGPNPDWVEIATAQSPASLSLSEGEYHIVVDKVRDFNASHTDLRVAPGHVHHFKASLSQGAFMAFLRVSSNVKGAHVWLDDPRQERPEWGTTPYGELVEAGDHEVLVAAPGFELFRGRINISSGGHQELTATLTRVGYGFIRLSSDAPAIHVLLDGKPAGTWKQGEPKLLLRATAGPHALLVSAEGRKDLQQKVVVPRGQVLPVRTYMIPTYPRGAAWTQAVLSAVCIGAGTALGLASKSLERELQDEREIGTLQADDSRIGRGRWFAIGADAGFALGGVLALLATWNFVKDPLPESSAVPGAALEPKDTWRNLSPGAQLLFGGDF